MRSGSLGKGITKIRAVQTGAGAAGVATERILSAAGLSDLIVGDTRGATHQERTNLSSNPAKTWLAEETNPRGFNGSIKGALDGEDFYLGLSGPGAMQPSDLSSMNSDAIVFALANPDPEIYPADAEPYARIIATGRSDFPNQINNILCFSGLFRGILDVGLRSSTKK
jgi:malate dehydrogenase (oxaloacetate-decarboxylating)